MQADILDGRPDNRQATSLGGEHIDLVGTLAHVTEQTLNRIGGLNVSVQSGRKGIKRQEGLFVLGQASHHFRVAQRILGFEGGQAGQCLLFCRLLPDTHEFGLDVTSFSPRDGIEHVALLMQQTAFTRGSRKLFADRSQQSLMPIGYAVLAEKCIATIFFERAQVSCRLSLYLPS
jgi:hypothetical protein